MQHLFTLWLGCLMHYGRMTLFRSSPSNLPYHPGTILLSLLAYLAAGFILLGSQRGLLSIAGQIVLEVGILLTICWIALKITQKTERLLQTLSALIGVNLIISLIMIPIFQFLPLPAEGEAPDPVTLQVNIILLIWNLAALSLVMKRAFEIQTLLAGVIAFNYFLLYEFILVNFLS